MASKEDREKLLERVGVLQHELEYLKKDILRNLATISRPSTKPKPSLFGSVQGGDITEETIQAAKRDLFRHFKDV
jgi:predicted lipoprotein